MTKKNPSLETFLEEPCSRVNGRFKGPEEKKGGHYGWHFA